MSSSSDSLTIVDDTLSRIESRLGSIDRTLGNMDNTLDDISESIRVISQYYSAQYNSDLVNGKLTYKDIRRHDSSKSKAK